jgi:hypothetical protein
LAEYRPTSIPREIIIGELGREPGVQRPPPSGEMLLVAGMISKKREVQAGWSINNSRRTTIKFNALPVQKK